MLTVVSVRGKCHEQQLTLDLHLVIPSHMSLHVYASAMRWKKEKRKRRANYKRKLITRRKKEKPITARGKLITIAM